mmetsp:Transcript_45723/g.111317  ORF Transcript_45723/g.111317 Transcript_45723/m.111317 type:complete len:213 (-) Transcript_45723:12-650(-)
MCSVISDTGSLGFLCQSPLTWCRGSKRYSIQGWLLSRGSTAALKVPPLSPPSIVMMYLSLNLQAILVSSLSTSLSRTHDPSSPASTCASWAADAPPVADPTLFRAISTSSTSSDSAPPSPMAILRGPGGKAAALGFGSRGWKASTALGASTGGPPRRYASDIETQTASRTAAACRARVAWRLRMEDCLPWRGMDLLILSFRAWPRVENRQDA